jgi:hypothetical protein
MILVLAIPPRGQFGLDYALLGVVITRNSNLILTCVRVTIRLMSYWYCQYALVESP